MAQYRPHTFILRVIEIREIKPRRARGVAAEWSKPNVLQRNIEPFLVPGIIEDGVEPCGLVLKGYSFILPAIEIMQRLEHGDVGAAFPVRFREESITEPWY